MTDSLKRIVSITTLALTLITIAAVVVNPSLLDRSDESFEEIVQYKRIRCYDNIGNTLLNAVGEDFTYLDLRESISFKNIATKKQTTVIGLECIITDE